MSPQKKKKKVKRVFIWLGEKKNETVGLFPNVSGSRDYTGYMI